MEKIRIRDNNGHYKEIGEIDYDTFYKRVKEDIHLFKKGDAWGLDYESLVHTISPKCTYISIFEINNQEVYIATIRHFFEKGFAMEFGGHRKQWFMQRKYFSSDKESAKEAYEQHLAEVEREKKLKTAQTSLFD